MPMESCKIDVNEKKLTKNITLEVRLVGLKLLRVRLFVATKIMRAAALFLGCSLDIKTDKDIEVPVCPYCKEEMCISAVDDGFGDLSVFWECGCDDDFLLGKAINN